MLANRQNAPTVGCVAALAATVIAITLFPAEPGPRGALVLPGLILTAGVLVIPIMRALTGSDDVANAENFVMVGFVFWLLLDLVQGAYDLRDASNEAIRQAFISIGVSAAAVWLGMAGRPWHLPGWLLEVTNRPLALKTIVRLVPACFGLGMLHYAYASNFDIPLMFSYLGQHRWSAPWMRGQLGGWGSFMEQLPYFGYVLPSLTAILIARHGLLKPTTLFAVACSVVMLLFLSQGGGRRLIGVTVGAALLVWTQANPGRLRLKNVVVIGMTGLVLAFISQFMLSFRGAGLEEFLSGGGTEYDYLHVDDNFLRLAQIIDIVPQHHPFVGTAQLVFTLVRPVPRVFWPGKPITPGFDLSSELGMRDVSLTSSIIGEWYMTYGWLAVVFGGWLHGRLASSANVLRDRGRSTGNPIVYALAVMTLVAGMRSMVELMLMSYALAAWWGVNRLVSKRHAVHA